MNCAAIMKERKRKNRGDVWRCPRARYRKELFLRAGCAFFSFHTDTVRHSTPLPLVETLEIMYVFVMALTTLRQAAGFFGHCQSTILSWWHLCSEVCKMTLDREPRYIGTIAHPVQVDESFFFWTP